MRRGGRRRHADPAGLSGAAGRSTGSHRRGHPAYVTDLTLANLSGHGASDLPALKEREFTDVNKFTFNEFLSSVKPKLQYKVKDTLSGDDDSELPVDLSFKNMKDFDPEGVVKQIKPLNDLLNIRTNLADLRRRATTSDEVTQLLQNIMDNEDARKAVADKLGSGGGAAADDAGGDDGAAPAEGAV